MPPTPRLLTLSADAVFAEGLNAFFGQHGLAAQAEAGVTALRDPQFAQRFDIVLLDLPAAGPQALASAHELRLRTTAPFIVLLADADSAGRVAGLDTGAADCLSKPFLPRELLARIRAVLRRVADRAPTPRPQRLLSAEPEALLFDGWVLQTLTRRLTSPRGDAVALSSAEFQLLQAFLQSPRRLLSREQLMARARQRDGEPVLRSIDLLVSRLRHKLADESAVTPLIKTVRGHGYMLDSRPTPLAPQA